MKPGRPRLVRDHGRPSPAHRWQTGFAFTTAVAIFAVYLLLLTRGAAWLDGDSLRGLTPEQRASEIDSVRGYLIQYGAGVLAFGALIYTARNFRLSREGHVTDRYTKAIEQLGSGSLDVRLGGIYALERIMVDSPRDHPAIVEVLAAFIRERSPVTTSTDDRRPTVASSDGQRQAPNTPPTTDVRAALTVLGRRPAGRAEQGSLNLRHTSLVNVELSDADLFGADLSGTDLSGALLPGADLSGADLTGANLRNADLPRAVLRDARMPGADLSGAKLRTADLAGAYLSGAKLHNADLSHADLSGALLPGANLSDADLTGANLTGANLHNVDVRGAYLSETDLSSAQRAAVKGEVNLSQVKASQVAGQPARPHAESAPRQPVSLGRHVRDAKN
jgi:hypothetical protein